MKKLMLAAGLALGGATTWAGLNPWGLVRYSDGTEAYLQTTNELGEAMLTDADLDAAKTATNVAFLVDTAVDQISLADRELAFTGDGITLTTRGKRSALSLSGDSAWTVRGLTFRGAGQTLSDFAPYDGGAIRVDGGCVTLDGCTFTNFVTRFTGGAVSALRLQDDSLVTNCTFVGNSAHPINGYGGALYATQDAAAGAVTLSICASRFADNTAENGGALCTLTVAYADEAPVAVTIGDGTVFEKNVAVYEGGAIIAEGALSVSGSNTLFRANGACLSGGAICLTGIEGDTVPVTLDVREATFADNAVGTNTTWAAGGAIAVLPAGSQLVLGGHALFTNNVANTAGGSEPAFGGAVYAAAGVTNSFTKVAFVGNRAESAGGVWCYGGAVSAEPGMTTVDTCVFDCGAANYGTCYGNALDFNAGEVMILNTTIRRGQVEAVSSYRTALAVTNCVIVGNGLKEGFSDLYLEESTLAMAYTAYGSLMISHASDCTATNNLSARVAGEVYDGESLKLRGTGFNPVAGLGLVQTATDFDGVAYGSLDYGYSMGAYETPTERLLVVLDGSKVFDTTASSNGCAWTWKLYTNEVSATEAVWGDLGKVEKAFVITNWTFGAASVGSYCSTNAAPNDITAGVEGKTATIEWLRTVLDFLYTGTISKESNVLVVYAPKEYAWTGEAITPGDGYGSVIVSNTVSQTVLGPDEYALSWLDNVEPTDAAKLVVTCTNNYDFVQTNLFAITAYLTEYYVDGTLSGPVVTNGSLSASNAVAVISVPDGYCLDYQNATTNKAVYVFGQGEMGEPDVTTLVVLYETDANGDKVPDKYQRQVLFATVNGYWDGTQNGRDLIRWVTLTNATPYSASEGTWATDGTCTLTAADVPAVGNTPFERFAKESETPGTWNVEPVGSVVGATGFPLYFYSPTSVDNPGRGDHDTPMEPVKLALGAASRGQAQTAVEVGGLRNVLSITDFALDENGDVSGAVMAQVINTLNGTPLAEMTLARSEIEVWGAETPAGEWFRLCTVTTDADGVWTVSRTRAARTLSAQRTATGDRTASLAVSTAGIPQFFQVRLAED